MNYPKSILGGLLLLAVAGTSQATGGEAVLIMCDGNCNKAVRAVKKAGGTVSYEYKYVDAIAATVPDAKRGALSQAAGITEITKDLVVAAPKARERVDLEGLDATVAGAGVTAAAAVAGGDEVGPEDYWFNATMMGADAMFGAGYLGDGAITAVIDDGTAPLTAFQRGGCTSATPTLLGGEVYIGGADPTEPSATSHNNSSHGSWVGTTIAANVVYLFNPASTIAQSMAIHAPDSIFFGGGVAQVPLVGVAPCSHIYALKVFSAFGGGAPTSDVVAAMERAIELRVNYDNGVPSVPVSGSGTADDPYVYDSLNITTVNMSLGGAALYATGEIDDILTEVMIDVGITLVNSAGNEGFAAMTGGSAGTGRGSLTAGATNSAAHERILRDLQFGLGVGSLYRASDHLQVAEFSSRGPSADGRISTDAVANGYAIIAVGAADICCSIVSGTSFSAPQIAGASALLHQAFPDATGEQVRNALVYSANPSLVGHPAHPIDQGHGFVDIPAAWAMLNAGAVPAGLPSGAEGRSVTDNVEVLGFDVVSIGNGGLYTQTLTDLVPGQVAHIFLESHKHTEGFTISLENLAPALPPAQQNAFFGDDLFVMVQDARTSDEDLLFVGFLNSDTVIPIDDPETGIVRVAVLGDWTNAGTISADVVITEQRGSGMKKLAGGKVAQGESHGYAVELPGGLDEVTFELSWNNGWGSFPTDDLDMILFNGALGFVFDGATLNSPERATIPAPPAGTYQVFVDGFTVWGVHGGAGSKYQLHAWDQDGDTL